MIEGSTSFQHSKIQRPNFIDFNFTYPSIIGNLNNLEKADRVRQIQKVLLAWIKNHSEIFINNSKELSLCGREISMGPNAPSLLIDSSHFTQLGVKDRIQLIEIDVNSNLILIDTNGQRHTVDRIFSDIPRFDSIDKLEEYLDNISIQVKQFNTGEYKIVTHALGVGGSPLHEAIDTGDLDKVRRLVLEQNCDVNGKINRGKNRFLTPLYLACEKGFHEIARFLIEHGADVNANVELHLIRKKNFQYMFDHSFDAYIEGSPLYIACKNHHVQTVQILLESGANVNKEYRYYYWKDMAIVPAILWGCATVYLLPITIPTTLVIYGIRARRKFYKPETSKRYKDIKLENPSQPETALKLIINDPQDDILSLLVANQTLNIPRDLKPKIDQRAKSLTDKAVIALLDKSTMEIETLFQENVSADFILRLVNLKKLELLDALTLSYAKNRSDIALAILEHDSAITKGLITKEWYLGQKGNIQEFLQNILGTSCTEKCISVYLDREIGHVETILDKAFAARRFEIPFFLLNKGSVEPDRVFKIACDKNDLNTIRLLFEQDRKLDLQINNEKFGAFSISVKILILDRQLALGQFINLREHCNEILLSNPNQLDALNYRGIAWYYLGCLEESKADFEQVLSSINSKDPTALRWKAWIGQVSGKYQEALSSFKYLVDTQPENNWAYLIYANSLLEVGKASDALNQAKKSLSLKQSPAAHFLCAEALMALGIEEEARQTYAQYRGQIMNEELYYLSSARLSLKLGLLEESEKDIFRGLISFPNSLDLLLMRAKVAALSNKYDEAIEAYNALIKLNPPNVKEIIKKRDEYRGQLKSSESKGEPSSKSHESTLKLASIVTSPSLVPQSDAEKLKTELAKLENVIQSKKLLPSQCVQKFKELEPLAQKFQSSEFYASRGDFYYKEALTETNSKRRLAHLANAKIDLETALGYDSFAPNVAELLEKIENQVKSESLIEKTMATPPDMPSALPGLTRENLSAEDKKKLEKMKMQLKQENKND